MAKVKTKKSSAGPVFSKRRALAILIIGGLLLAVFSWEIVKPVRQTVAVRFLDRGDTLVKSGQFDLAEREYKRALLYNPRLSAAREHQRLVSVAQADPLQAQDLFVDLNMESEIEKLRRATAEYSTVPESIAVGVSFLNANEPQYARYALERTTQLDPGYPEGWHYLAEAYEKLAEISAQYRDKAEDARQKRDELTARWR